MRGLLRLARDGRVHRQRLHRRAGKPSCDLANMRGVGVVEMLANAIDLQELDTRALDFLQELHAQHALAEQISGKRSLHGCNIRWRARIIASRYRSRL